MKVFPKTEILKKIEWLQDVFVIRREELSFEVDELIKETFLEVITEFKELQNKSCDGCRHYVQINKSDSFVCSLLLDCSRKYKPKDRFEAKDKQ